MKYSVLTYIFGNGDILREVPKDENVEYICVTDNPHINAGNWTIIVDEDLKDMHPLQASFYVRHHPFKYCSTDICMRIDGSIKINESLTPMFEEFDASGKDMCVMVNSRAKNLVFEFLHWIGYSKVITKQLEIFKQNGVNVLLEGSLQSPISIVRNNKLCNDCDALCWYWIENLEKEFGVVRPSQTILTASVKVTAGLDVMFVSEDLIHSKYMQWFQHNSDEKLRYSKVHYKHTKFFDQPIEIYTFK